MNIYYLIDRIMIKIKIEQNKQRRFKRVAVKGPVIDRVRSSL